MEGDQPSKSDLARKDASVPGELPAAVQRVAPAPPPTNPATASSTSAFANVQLRPEGQRYGDADLLPGGSLEGNGGMMMTERNFPRRGQGMQGDHQYGMPGNAGRGFDGQPGFGNLADGYARFDPMFPGQQPPHGRGGGGLYGGRGGYGPAPRMPGEPDDDNFFPPGGRPGEPFGGPGGGQFGPRQGGWGGYSGGGGGSPWA